MNNSDKEEVAREIQSDLQKGIYNTFPKLKERLSFIASKLLESIYIQNKELSSGEIKTLVENDYIESN
jgi:hypothetical protein